MTGRRDCPTCGVPVIKGLPVAGVFAAATVVALSTFEAAPVPMVFSAATR